MSVHTINDARQYIFPIFSMQTEGNGVRFASRKYLGTGFFVTKHGDGISAGHVLVKPEFLAQDERLVAVITIEGKEQVCWINHAAHFDELDLALFKVNLSETKYFEISADQPNPGSDVQVVGIPSHEIHNAGKEMRVLKGHITFAPHSLELSFPIPPGMSGSPVFSGIKVVACATGSTRTEEVIDSEEEIEKLSPQKEIIHKTKILKVTEYGIAMPFSHLTHPDPIFEGKSLVEFISAQNAKS